MRLGYWANDFGHLLDKRSAHRRLTEAGLDERQANALTALLWSVHETGRIEEIYFARLSDAGFRHVEVCVMRELLTVALSRRSAGERGDSPARTLLGAFIDPRRR